MHAGTALLLNLYSYLFAQVDNFIQLCDQSILIGFLRAANMSACMFFAFK